MSWIIILLALLGVVTLVWKFSQAIWSVVQVAVSVLTPFFQPGADKSLNIKFGPWAVITGSTDGIGKYYARELARQGLNIVLISRSKDKLMKVASEIERDYPVKTKIIQADFSEGQSVYKEIEELLKDIDVGVLVNNVGKQYSYPMFLTEVPEKELWDIININVGAVTMMTKIVLPHMKARGKGAIVNISSGSELQPLPLMTVYAATKAFVKSFTAAIRYEYRRYGLVVQHVAPFFVSTKMNQFADSLMNSSSPFVPNAELYARHAVSTLGRSDCTTGYWAHGIQYFIISLAPLWARILIGGHLNEGFRREYFQNLEKSKL